MKNREEVNRDLAGVRERSRYLLFSFNITKMCFESIKFLNKGLFLLLF